MELLSFDPSELGPAPSPPTTAPATDKLLRLKALLDRPVDVVVQDCSEVADVLQDLEDLVPAGHFFRLYAAGQLAFMRPVVEGDRRRITLRGSQASLKTDIRARCTQLNAKKAVLDAKVSASTDTARLETLKERLRALEDEARAVRESIAQEESSLAASSREAQDLSSELKGDIASLQSLRRQLVGGDDRADEALIAGVDQIRLDVLAAVEELLP